jgi:predicted transcriptional regulator
MVRDSTLLAVRDALSTSPRPLRDIAETVQMEKNTVRNALKLLIRLGLAERIDHEEPQESSRKCGWVRVEYRLIHHESV